MEASPASNPPLVLTHAGDGGAVHYSRLAPHLLGQRDVYALEAGTGNQPAAPPPSVESLAEECVAALPEPLRSGPVHLGGWSFGGVVALEIARRLAREGVPPWVLLLDTWSPVALRQVGLLPPERPGSTAPAGAGGGGQRSLLPAPWAAMARYRPAGYAGSVMLIRAQDDPHGRRADDDLGWGRIVEGQLLTAFVPGTHGDILDPGQVARTGRTAADLLSRADRDQTT